MIPENNLLTILEESQPVIPVQERTLSQLINEGRAILQAIVTHPDYQEMQQNDYLTGLDITLPDADLFLEQLAQTYDDWSLIDDPSNE